MIRVACSKVLSHWPIGVITHQIAIHIIVNFVKFLGEKNDILWDLNSWSTMKCTHLHIIQFMWGPYPVIKWIQWSVYLKIWYFHFSPGFFLSLPKKVIFLKPLLWLTLAETSTHEVLKNIPSKNLFFFLQLIYQGLRNWVRLLYCFLKLPLYLNLNKLTMN